MVDVSNGKERMRQWPTRRGKKLHPKTLDQMEWFRQAQWACKYMQPEIMQMFAEATKGTPFLPRDLATMMMAGRLFTFVFPDNTRLYSVQTRNDVSESLDAISMTPGHTLVRGPDFWTSQEPIVSTVKGAILNRAAATPSFASNVAGVITWTTEQLDQRNYWNVAFPTRFTVDQEGWYQLFYTMQRVQSTNFGGDLIVRKNGVEITRTRWNNTNGYTGATPFISLLDYADTNDYYECWVVCYGAAATYTLATGRIAGPF